MKDQLIMPSGVNAPTLLFDIEVLIQGFKESTYS
jgi:hypothetical protein